MEKSLEKMGLSHKESIIYLKLLELSPSPLRKIAEETDMNRGTVYDTLKSLMRKGLVSFYDKDKKQHFMAEDPENLINILRDRRREVIRAKKELERVLPELQIRHKKSDERPFIKMYESDGGAKAILEDVLRTMAQEDDKEYYVYSSFTRDMREHLYRDFESFSERRVKLGIKVKTIGPSSGGALRGLDERRTMQKLEDAPSYIIIYGHKVAILSFSKNNYLTAVLIQDQGFSKTERLVFETLWENLPEWRKK
jgi:sugar-specific transcriptional regulator TrmB